MLSLILAMAMTPSAVPPEDTAASRSVPIAPIA